MTSAAMEPATNQPGWVTRRSQILAAKAVVRSAVGTQLPVQPCRRCGIPRNCRPYEFKARRRLRLDDSGGLGSNTTGIMAKDENMISGAGGICAPCMETFLQPYLARRVALLLWLGIALCFPLPFWLLIQHRSLHAMSNPAYLAFCFWVVLFLLGLASLASAWFADLLLAPKFDRVLLNQVAAIERVALRERFSAESYALQIGLRFTQPPSSEIINGDDVLPATGPGQPTAANQ